MLTESLIRRFVATSGDVSSPELRARVGSLEGWVSIVVNLTACVIKLVPGLLIGSVSLVADAIHSLSDVATSAVVIWGFRASAKPSDEKHPFGHGRIESVAALVIAMLLLLAAFEFGKSSIERLLEPRAIEASWSILAALLLTVVMKEWLARFSGELGRRIGSTALVADAWHHRTDALSTGAVIAALATSRLGIAWVDGAAGLVVSAILAWTGVQLVRESIHPLIGEAPDPEMVAEIRREALATSGVDNVHDIIVHHYGTLVVVSLHIEVDAVLDATRCHEIAEDVEEGIKDRHGGWAVVHVDPVDRAHPLYDEVEAELSGGLGEIGGEIDLHDLRIVGRTDPCYVIFDLAAEDPAHAREAGRVLRRRLRARFPEVAKVVVNIDPRFLY